MKKGDDRMKKRQGSGKKKVKKIVKLVAPIPEPMLIIPEELEIEEPIIILPEYYADGEIAEKVAEDPSWWEKAWKWIIA